MVAQKERNYGDWWEEIEGSIYDRWVIVITAWCKDFSLSLSYKREEDGGGIHRFGGEGVGVCAIKGVGLHPWKVVGMSHTLLVHSTSTKTCCLF